MRALALAAAAALPAARGADPLGPGKGPWEVEAASAHGLDAAKLATAKDYIFKNSPTRGCVVVIKDGALVYEGYSDAEFNTTAHQGYSQTKSLGALVAGYAVTQGKLDIDADITKTYGVTSPKSYPVTSRQIMSQALAGDTGPGEKWEYDAVGRRWINHMASVVANAAGRTTSDIWKKQFAEPLGLENFSWRFPDSMWASGSAGTCRDYARIGQLMLNKGKWKGVADPIVSADYIHEMGIPQTRYAPYKNYSNPCYGLLTWLDVNPDRQPEYPGVCLVPIDTPVDPSSDGFPDGSPRDIFFPAGAQGQITMVVPDHNAVIVSMGKSSGQNGVAGVMYRGMCHVFGDCDARYHATAL